MEIGKGRHHINIGDGALVKKKVGKCSFGFTAIIDYCQNFK
jgi:hypothetical protein